MYGWTYLYGLMDSYYILLITLCYCHVFGCLVPSGVSSVLLVYCYYSFFVSQYAISDPSCTFPAQVLESAISSSILGSFEQRILFRNTVSCAQRPFHGTELEILIPLFQPSSVGFCLLRHIL